MLARYEKDDYTWLYGENVDRTDVDQLQAEFHFHELDLEDVLSKRQRPKIDTYQDYLFVVLHFPVRQKDSIVTLELDAFIAADLLITLPSQINDELKQVYLNKPEADSGPYLFYQVVKTMLKSVWVILDELGRKVEMAETEIFAGNNRQMVRTLSDIKQEIITCRRVIKPSRLVFRSLEAQLKTRDQRLEGYYDDLVDSVERMWDLLENYNEVIKALEETNESVLSHSLNDRILVLTLINVTVLPLTLVAGLYGMNVPLPGSESDQSFWIILIIMAVLVIGSILLWRRRQ